MKINNEAIKAINKGNDIPLRIANKEIKLVYKSIDGWRGYWNVEPTKKSNWQIVESGAINGSLSGATEEEVKTKCNEIEKEGFETLVVLTPTSNVFSIGYDILKRQKHS